LTTRRKCSASPREALLRYGYEVVTAENGRQALTLLAEFPDQFDLVILDLVMPGLTGQETLARIRELNPVLPVLISSGYVPQTEEEMDQIPIRQAIWSSPSPLEQLLNAVRSVFDRS